ncbi:J domain-containing protein [Hymenobacter psoromatis]|uniref:J domain-containing protein n=1 Tax=Hymenobacter psoromatis TaxID=1484116 RepID=UPI001CC10191
MNYFQVLGLQFGASTEEIRRAYREYAKHFHPDKHQNSAFFTDRFRSVQEAYELLIDKARREQFEQSFQGEKLRELNKALAEEKKKASALTAGLAETEAKCKQLLSENAELIKIGEKRNIFGGVFSKTKHNWKLLVKWTFAIAGAILVVYKLFYPSLTNLELLQKECDSMLNIINDKYSLLISLCYND